MLGSLPGPESLRRRQYYAQPQNAFWRIMGELFGAGPDRPYDERLAALTANGVALWDVCESATRVGALDSAIEHGSVVVNDFARFFRGHRQIGLVCCNGQKAAELYRRLVLPTLPAPAAAIERCVLPSTSPAYAALRFEAKLEAWSAVRAVAN